MYAAQYGWWLVTPENGNAPRHETFGAFDLPELPASETLHEVWQDLGACGRLFDGTAVPFQWSEMQAHMALMRTDMPPICWQTLRGMSAAYAQSLQDKNPLSIEPMDREGVADDG